MATVKRGPNAWSEGAKRLLLQADKNLNKPYKEKPLQALMRGEAAKRAGISEKVDRSQFGTFYENKRTSERGALEKAIKGVKDESAKKKKK